MVDLQLFSKPPLQLRHTIMEPSDEADGIKKQPQPIDTENLVKASVEEERPSSWFSSGSSWLANARQKALTTVDAVRKDLSEFSDVMTKEVADLTQAAHEGLNSTVSVVRQQAQLFEQLVTPDEEGVDVGTDMLEAGKKEKEEIQKKQDDLDTALINEEDILAKMEKSASMGFGWMKSIVGTVTDSVKDTVRNLAMEESFQGEENFTQSIKPRVRGRNLRITDEQLYNIQKSEATYTTAPEDDKTFDLWLSNFSKEEHDGEIELLRKNNEAMRNILDKLVPSTMDEFTFWTRYFFAVAMADINEEMNQEFTLKKPKVPGKSIESTLEVDQEGGAVVDQPTSPARSADDWSVCSDKNDVEEVSSSTGSEDDAPATPLPSDDSKNTDSDKKEDGWVNWDE